LLSALLSNYSNCTNRLAISGLSLHTPSDLIVKSAGRSVCAFTNSKIRASTFGLSASIMSNTNAEEPARFSCMSRGSVR
jgi:hypothetical protein